MPAPTVRRFANANRVAAHGAGLRLTDRATDVDIVAAVARLTTTPLFNAAASQLSKAMAFDLNSTALVTEVENVAALWRRHSP
jgi:UDP:flavonoid glycosyltransferase YjiC (YdhE family)